MLDAIEHFFAKEIADGTFKMISPRDASRRGATICFSIEGVDALRIQKALITDKHGLGYKFEVDLGPGNESSFRITPHCCHMSFTDTVNLAFCFLFCLPSRNIRIVRRLSIIY